MIVKHSVLSCKWGMFVLKFLFCSLQHSRFGLPSGAFSVQESMDGLCGLVMLFMCLAECHCNLQRNTVKVIMAIYTNS
jgi:hypothetical protein